MFSSSPRNPLARKIYWLVALALYRIWSLNGLDERVLYEGIIHPEEQENSRENDTEMILDPFLFPLIISSMQFLFLSRWWSTLLWRSNLTIFANWCSPTSRRQSSSLSLFDQQMLPSLNMRCSFWERDTVQEPRGYCTCIQTVSISRD